VSGVKGVKDARKGRIVRVDSPARPARSDLLLAGDLKKVLLLIRRNPGIRPSEINRRLNLEQSDGYRNTLLRRGLVRKTKDGNAMRYYPV